MEKGKFWPPATPKPLNRSSPKFPQVITSGIPTILQKLFPRMHDFAHQIVYSAILGVQEITYSQDAQRILTQNTSKDAVPGKDVPFGGHKTKI